MRGKTAVVFVESPGSHTFEVQDVPALARAAHARGAKVLMDNTWGFHFFQPFRHGVDVSIQALTKYAGGHSDILLGGVTVNDEADWKRYAIRRWRSASTRAPTIAGSRCAGCGRSACAWSGRCNPVSRSRDGSRRGRRCRRCCTRPFPARRDTRCGSGISPARAASSGSCSSRSSARRRRRRWPRR